MRVTVRWRPPLALAERTVTVPAARLMSFA